MEEDTRPVEALEDPAVTVDRTAEEEEDVPRATVSSSTVFPTDAAGK